MVTHGAHVLVVGESPVKADVVFVHGLRGDAFETWTAEKACWPRDFLKTEPKLKHTRIITWGYDSSIATIKDFSSQSSIFGHAENLLSDLSRRRQENAEETRPIVFVGHSLGGLVIKEALIRSAQYLHNDQAPDLGALYQYTAGVVFMGTPHRGSDQTGLAKIVSNIARLTLRQPNDKLVGNLSKESDVLENQRKGFVSISKELPVVCLSEEKPVVGIGKIVDETSAVCDGFYVRSNSIPANHMDMCKYPEKEDIGYERTSGVIIRLVVQATEKNVTTSRSQQSLPPQLPFSIQDQTRDHDGRTALHHAALGGKRVELGHLLNEMHQDPNIEDGAGMTPLHLAAEAGMANMIIPLLKKKADLEAEDDRGRTPLACAAAEGRSNVVKILLGKGANPNAKDNEGRTPVYRAVTNGPSNITTINERFPGRSFAKAAGDHVNHGEAIAHDSVILPIIRRVEDTIRTFVEEGIDLEVHLEFDALAYAVKCQQLAVCEYLIFRRLRSVMKVGCYDFSHTLQPFATWKESISRLMKYKPRLDLFSGERDTESTVLHWAASSGNTELAQLMIEIGEHVDAKAGSDVTPFHEAARSGHIPTMRMLIDSGADVNKRESRNHQSSLERAVPSKRVEVVRILLESGANPNPCENATWSNDGGSLALATFGGNEAILKILIPRVRSIDEKGQLRGQTALMISAYTGNTSIVRLLVDYGADVRARDSKSISVLHHAVARASPRPGIVRYLLDHGAKPDLCTKDGEGSTPLDAAAFWKNKEIERILVEAGGKKASDLQ